MSNEESPANSSPNSSPSQESPAPASSGAGDLGSGTGGYTNPSWVSTRTEVPFGGTGRGSDDVGGE